MMNWLGYGSEEGTPELTSEDAKKAAAVVGAENGDEFKDALEDDDVDASKTFEVSAEELTIIRKELETQFPDDCTYLSDAYILSVASKPYSKDPTKRRPLEYSMEKLTNVMEWRAQEGAPEMEALVKLANGPEDAPEAVEKPEKLAKAKALATALNYAGLYFHGLTKDGRPVLWVRTNRMPWYPDVDAQCNALITLADAGIRAMPEGVTDFICISDSSYPPPPNPTFLIKLLKALVKGYPDRLKTLWSAPVSSVIQFVMNLLLPLMPGRLASKVVLLDLDSVRDKLKDTLMNGEEDIPTFFGGPCEHDKFFPEEASAENQGKGNLKFDYFGMVERLVQARKEFEASKK
eukprot:CAMPEP_0113623562 /NCGR_PEP_ID=MMETSP0017_2-20120614/12124_1 /TAXON_ID=2856 /ORGANISM="Cylindrotheca closterium" /LENGTH=347 /DNA_ID=CAMNT_0000533521 /DNA_START=97 /DNA_END=1140 /DNA_ORIENTATION=+ /assembly_acc=CAM_ASM_000147